MTLIIEHVGVKGMKWGVRKQYVSKREDHGYDTDYGNNKSSRLKIGDRVNRVAKGNTMFNKAGGLYVSTNAEDSARYIKNLGPSLLGKALRVAGDTQITMKVKKNIKQPTSKETIQDLISLYKKDKAVRSAIDDSMFSAMVTNSLDSNVKISKATLSKAVKNPMSNEGRRIASAVSATIAGGDPKVSKKILDHFRKKGYDAIPDIYDELTGTSKKPVIIINPKAVEFERSKKISKEDYLKAKRFVKKAGSLPLDTALEFKKE